MGDGHETASAVERLPRVWRGIARELRTMTHQSLDRQEDDNATLDFNRALCFEMCAADLIRALEEDGVIPSRMK